MYNYLTNTKKSVLSTELIKAKRNPDGSQIWKFSDLDITLMNVPIRGTWIFDSILDIENLKSNLVKLLTYYPHVTGRVTPDKKGIAHVNKGIPFIVREETEISVTEIQKDEEWSDRFLTPLNINDVKNGKIAPLNVTLTILKDGTVLSVLCSHCFVDGGSYYNFINNWGKLCRNEEIKKPLIDQSIFEVKQSMPKGEIKKAVIDMGWKKVPLGSVIKILSMSKTGIYKIRSGPFYFSPESIENLKNKISLEAGFNCSSNVAISAFIGKMYMMLNNLPPETKYSEAIVVNLRNRFDGIPDNFFGNAATAIPTGEFDRTFSLSEIAKTIHESLTLMLKGPSKKITDYFKISLALVGARLLYSPIDFSSIIARQPQAFYYNNLSKLPIYSVNFGTGEPIMVTPPRIIKHQVIIWPVSSSVSDGVEVYFSGNFARLVNKLKKDDPWLLMMKKQDMN